MKRYQFSLGSVLRARRAQEETARHRLAGANRQLREARLGYERTLDRYRSRPVATGRLDVGDFRAQRQADDRLAEAVHRARSAVDDAKVLAATCFAAWVETAKAVASLERLDERRRAEWRAQELREEAASVDDVVASRRLVAAAEAVRRTS